jgi:Uncharacterized low-complexity proteins
MANNGHLKRLQSGVSEWNSWRTTSADVPDLSGAHLNGKDLRGANFKGANLSKADLRAVDLRKALLTLSDLDGADLASANISGVDLTGKYLAAARLERANLSGTKLSGAVLTGADLRGSDLRGTDLGGAHLDKANLIEADLSEAYLKGANLMRALLIDANLGNADFRQAFIGRTIFGNNDLSTVKGLETVTHRFPSTLGVDTLFRSNGKIPEVFLRGVGVPDDFITFVPSLVGRAIEFYSCFISYSHQDEEFSQRLHSRMTSANLRVWYAPEDMKGGRKLFEEIFRAIQIHDKLLLVLSKDSMKSEWVRTEIRRAKTVEREENRRKLFPIRLIDFDSIQKWECFDSDTGTDLAAELREYYIPDFSKWKDHDSFEKEFAKLLRDLQTN